jgi:hypothetical protein
MAEKLEFEMHPCEKFKNTGEKNANNAGKKVRHASATRKTYRGPHRILQK